jgi:peroxiredoxin
MNVKECVLMIIALLFALQLFAMEIKTLEIGQKAPDFQLPGVDGKTYSLADFQNAKILTVIFTCNHCPTAQAYEQRIIQLVKDYKDRGVAFVAISPNSPKAVALSELAYTDLDDGFEDMKIRAQEHKFNFPYLYDGETQTTSINYGPAATPHVFIFDAERNLRYTGRIDDVENPYLKPTQLDTRNALEALLADKPVPVEKTKTFGCSIKWASKSQWVQQTNQEWAALPVNIDIAHEEQIKELMKNSSAKLRLVNVWASWCGPCVSEYPDFVKIHRIYGGRNFEFVSISADAPSKKDKVLEFLVKNQSAVQNYLFDSEDKYKLIEAVDPDWAGALPYTVLIAPGGKVLYRQMGAIDPLELKKAIIGFLGRYFADDK